MRLILSRKGFDSASGGCPSPIFPDGSMISLPIPDRRSPARYSGLSWNGRNVGEFVARLTRGRVRADHRAHLDPDLRREARPRSAGWRPSLGQRGIAQGHLRKQGVGPGDVFLFWGLFRAVDDDLRWAGPPEHHVWGWLQVGEVVAVDRAKVEQAARLAWASDHPHWTRDADPTNTLYVAGEDLSLPGTPTQPGRGAGVFDSTAPPRRLTRPDARGPSEWALPIAFLPRGRRALSYHDAADRWTLAPSRGAVHLQVVGRGQEFVLDLDEYPEVIPWLGKLIGRA
ncbi:MAG: hypothetical protein NDJ94_23150 [Vicinamibacteria bacterium]|nr:hypothetical protein [Vicinamibacteria bacterium]